MSMSAVYIIVFAGVGLVVGTLIGFLVRKKLVESRIEAIEEYSKRILAEAQKEAKTIKRETALQAKDSLYQMKLDFEKECKEKRDELQVHLKDNGVETLIHYPVLLHKQKAFKKVKVFGQLKHAELRSNQILSLPIYPWLTDEEVHYIIDCVKDFYS